MLGGTKHNTSVWISYGFIHFAYVMILLTPALTRKSQSAAVFGFTLSAISMGYFFLELIAGVIFILVAPDSYKTALLLQLCIAGFYGIILVLNLITNEHTAAFEDERHQQVSYIMDASAKLRVLLANEHDRGAKRNIELIYDAVRSSPVKTYPEAAQIEHNIAQLINELEVEVSTGNGENIASLTKSLLSAIDERNTCLKMLNK